MMDLATAVIFTVLGFMLLGVMYIVLVVAAAIGVTTVIYIIWKFIKGVILK